MCSPLNIERNPHQQLFPFTHLSETEFFSLLTNEGCPADPKKIQTILEKFKQLWETNEDAARDFQQHCDDVNYEMPVSASEACLAFELITPDGEIEPIVQKSIQAFHKVMVGIVVDAMLDLVSKNLRIY